MALNLSKLLKIEQEEKHVVYALLLQSVFIGIFAGALDVGANAMFLETHGAEQIPRAFMFSGVVGIIYTSIYTFLQSRIKFKYFAVLNLLVVLILTATLRISFFVYNNDWLVKAVFVMMGPLIIITLLGFWGTSGRLFTLRQGKRLFGIIDTGQVVGMILAFYAVPILVSFSFLDFDTKDTLYIGIGSLLIATILQVYLSRRFKFVLQAKEKSGRKSGFLTLFSSRYTSSMALFIALSVIVAFFIHFSFLSVTEERYPEGNDMVAFLGTFLGTMMIFTVILKSLFYGWLMKTYGLRVALLIAPVMLIILTIAASLIGGYFGYGAEAPLFTLFFLLISLSKLFNKSLKDSIEVPSMKILYQSLAPDIRYSVQSRIDGTVNEITAFFAGLVMAGLVLVSFIELIHFSYILLLFLVIWFIIGLRLYLKYKHSLQVTLSKAEELRPIADKSYLPEPQFTEEIYFLAEMIKANPYSDYFMTNNGYEMLQKETDPGIREIMGEYRGRSIKFLTNTSLKKVQRDRIQNDIRGYINYLSKVELPEKNNIEAAVGTGDKEIIFGALLSATKKGDIQQIPNIIALFRDPDIDLRFAAIETIELLKGNGAGAYLTEYLAHPLLYKVAWSALVSNGEDVIDNLENSFHKTGIGEKVQLRIVRAMTLIGGEKSIDRLFGKIDYHQREVAFEAVKGLYTNNFRIQEEQKPHLFMLIRELIETGAWNLAAKHTIALESAHAGLLAAIDDEIDRTNDLLFMMLGISYNKNSIKHIRNSLNNQETHDISYAVELLNLLIDEELKDYLEPYIEDISISEKIRRLQSEFPIEILSYNSLLHAIISRDGKKLGSYIRVCAIDEIRNFDQGSDDYLLPAQVFHPHPVIREAAGAVIRVKDSARFNNLNRRIEYDLPDYVDQDSPEELPIHPILSVVEDIRTWPLFEKADLNELFKLSNILEPFEEERVKDKKLMTLIRSDSESDRPELVFGMAIIPHFHKEKIEFVKAYATHRATSVYLLALEGLNELLFDNIGLLECFNEGYKLLPKSDIIKKTELQ